MASRSPASSSAPRAPAARYAPSGAPPSPPEPSPLLTYLPALVVPPLFAFNLTPSPTLLNQLFGVLGWGLCLAMMPGAALPGLRPGALLPLQAVLWLMMAAVVASWGLGSLPTSLALPPLAMLVFAAATALLGARAALAARVEPVPSAAVPAPAPALAPFEPFAIGMLVAGVLSTAVAMVQMFAPDWADGNVIAHTTFIGRAVGNLRQPNHLATLLLWSAAAIVPLAEARRAWRGPLAALGALMVFGVLLSASRTGQLGLLLLVVWGLVDRKLSRPVRLGLVAVLPLALVMWFGLDAWAHHTQHVFYAEARLSEKDISASRFAIWSNVLQMIRQQPWLGVGWGEFNLAWTLTPFPGRPTAFFDHTHCLPLQLWVELGVPLGTGVALLLLWALGQAGLRAWGTPGVPGAGARAAFMMVLMVLLHSLLEYPLWYAYFLLPAAWAWGHALGSGPPGPEPGAADEDGVPARVIRVAGSPTGLRWVGVAMIVGAVGATWDYWRVSQIFTASDEDAGLSERIARGQHSPLFAHHADYAAATTAEMPSRAFGAFEHATHALIDGRLMMAWANAYAEAGDLERARYIAARLKEFDKAEAEDFFAPCTDAAVTTQPYQCSPPVARLTWRDFR